MKVLKWLAIVLVALITLLLVGGMLISSKFTVTRSVVINAPADKIYPLVADPRGWKDWWWWSGASSSSRLT